MSFSSWPYRRLATFLGSIAMEQEPWAFQGARSRHALATELLHRPDKPAELGVPKELHHKIPQREGGLHTPDNLQEVWPWEHTDIDPFRHYNGPRPGG